MRELPLRKWFMYLGFFLVVCSNVLHAKVLIVTHSYNRPDFILLQQKTFERFLKDDYEFVVFNDGPTKKLSKQIEDICLQQKIRCIRVPQEIHQQPYLSREPWEDINTPSIRTSNALQYSFDTLAFDHEGIVAVIDSDMFLIREFSIENYLQDNDISAVAQWRGSMGNVKYIWNGLMFFNMRTLPNKRTLNFNCGTINGNRTDTGGFTYYYLKENPGAKVLYMREQIDFTDGEYIANSYDLEDREYLAKEEALAKVESLSLRNFLEEKPDDVQFYLNFAFLHYRRAGNYHSKSNGYHVKKTEMLNRFIEEITK